MPKGTKQKLKLYYLSKIMVEKTDDEHAITMPEIQQALGEYGVTADRKSLYDDLETLSVLGIEVIGEKEGRNYYYHVGKKLFEIAELKLLVDAVQSSKFITEKKSKDLIRKLTGFASNYEAMQLRRQVVVQGRVKSMNESIYYVVDEIHHAIANNKKIRFEYMRWNLSKKLERKRDKFYEVSPWTLLWDNENYYLIAYDSEAGKIKHYRVDKIRSVEVLDVKREGKEAFGKLDIAGYTSKTFRMYGGEAVKVRLRFKNDLVGVMIDRFGKEIPIHETDIDDWSETTVEVALSKQFYGWIFSLGPNIKIVGPEDVVRSFGEELEMMRNLYFCGRDYLD